MRLTISLDDDLYAAVKSLAQSEDLSMSAALNRLVRKAIYPVNEPLAVPSVRNGIVVVEGQEPITSEQVRRLEEEEP